MQKRLQDKQEAKKEIKEFPGQVDQSAPVYSDAPKPFAGQWFGGKQ